MMKLDVLPLVIFLLKIFLPTSKSISYCGDIPIQSPFLVHPNSSHSSFLSHMILCKSHKLYLRTSIGLFPISSIDYTNKLLTIDHTSCSSTSNFVSPQHLSFGFPVSSNPNSLILFNCSNQSPKALNASNFQCTSVRTTHGCYASSSASCLVIDDVENRLFDPRKLKCTHYRRVYKKESGTFVAGTKLSFEVDRVPNPCKECEKPYGNCGAGLRCICHPKQCKDKVLADGAVFVKPCVIILLYLYVLTIIILNVIM